MIRIAEVQMSSITPYSPAQYYDVPKLGRETHADYELRTWRERIHKDPATGMVYIPAMALKNTLQGAANFLGKKVPGRGQKTFASFFKQSSLVMENMTLNIHVDKVEGEQFFVPSDGKVGGGKRVMKTFARIEPWSGTAKYFFFDETITERVFEEHIKAAGLFVGLGRFRPERGGFYGRFKIEGISWVKQAT